MPTFHDLCAAANTQEVEVPPFAGIRFRIRRLSTETLAEVGSAQVLALREARARAPGAEPDIEGTKKQRSMMDTILAAAVLAVDWGEGFQLVEIAVTDEQRAAGHLRPSDDWPPGLAPKLMGLALQMSGDDEGAATRIASFLGGAGGP